MATPSSLFTPIAITTTNRHIIKPPSATNKWWGPLFGGVPSDPDYIVSQPTTTTTDTSSSSSSNNSNNNKFAPGCFTEEKAKQLRMKTVEMSNFHDVMYHSAIASRLASDPFIFDIDSRTLEYGREDFCLIMGFRFSKVNLDPDEEDHSEFRMRVFPKIENLMGEHLLELVNKDVKFAKLDDEDAALVFPQLNLNEVADQGSSAFVL
nr:uncharacterized protein [Tanacetum cinerariifolium]